MNRPPTPPAQQLRDALAFHGRGLKEVRPNEWQMELQNGGLAHICASFAADDLSPAPWTFTVKVIGTAGTTHYTYNDWVEVKAGISHSHTYTAYQATITNEVRHFVELCNTRTGAPLSDLEDAIWAQRATEAVERSIAEGVTAEV